MSYKDIAVQAQKRRADAIPKEYLLPQDYLKKVSRDQISVLHGSGHFSHAELEIIESEAEDILQKIKTRIWTAVEVTQAFCKAAAVAQQLTNCLTEVLFPEALARATQLDDFLERTGSVVGPLHGLPISLKDCFITPPHPSSIGMASYAKESTATQPESVLVSMLRELGAVAYVKTNTPTAMMMMESVNNVWGQTTNPYNSGCSAGGSSGGEGALVAMRGSPLGIGTDIGGSIRIPSAFNGLYSLKPSFSRFPTYGTRSGIPGNDFIFSVNGPMARSLASIKLYCETVLSGASMSSSPWLRDPKCIPVPWKTTPQIQPANRPLRLAFLPPHDGYVTAQPPVVRALAMTKKAVAAAGHEVIDWQPTGHFDMLRSVLGGFLDQGGPAIDAQRKFTDEPWFPGMHGYQQAAEAAEAGHPLTAAQLRDMNLVRNALQKSYLDRWQASGTNGKQPIDAIVGAVTPWSAVRAGFTNSGEHGHAYFGFTAIWSLLDMPAVTVPVTRAHAAVDGRAEGFEPLSDLDRAIQDDYDPEFYEGTPVALQAIGERLGEEKLLEVAAAIEEALKNAGAK